MRFSGRLSGVLLVVAALLFASFGVVPAHAVAAASVSGTVSTEDGTHPYAEQGGWVDLNRKDADGEVLRFASYYVTTGDYEFRGLEPGTYTVSVRFTGEYAGRESAPFVLRDGEKRTGVNVVLARGASISGAVSAPFVDPADPTLTISLERWAPELAPDYGWVGERFSQRGEGGAKAVPFAFGALDAGRYRITVEGGEPRHLITHTDELDLMLGQQITDLDVPMDVAAVVRGRTRMADGGRLPEEAVPGPDRSLVCERVVAPTGDVSCEYGADRYVTFAPGGDFVAYLRADDTTTFRLEYGGSVKYWAAPIDFSARSGDEIDGLEFVLRPSAVVTGTVAAEGRTWRDDDEHGAYVTVHAERRNAFGAWEEVSSKGLFGPGAFTVLVPGPEPGPVRLKFTGHDGVFSTVYWDGSKYGTTDAASASLIHLVPGQERSGLGLVLRPPATPPVTTVPTEPPVTTAPLKSVKAPKVSDTAKVGTTLTVVRGIWSTSGVAESFQWLRNGHPIAGATRSTHKLASADRGKRISVRVRGALAGATSTVTSASTDVVKQSVSLAASARGAKKKATVRVTIAGSGVPKSTLGGTVAVYLGGRKVSTGAVREGKATVVVRGQKKGKRSYVVNYLGTSTLLPAARTVRVTIR